MQKSQELEEELKQLREVVKAFPTNVIVDTDLLMLLLFSDSGLKIIRWSRRA